MIEQKLSGMNLLIKQLTDQHEILVDIQTKVKYLIDEWLRQDGLQKQEAAMIKVHESITFDRIEAVLENDENVGFCIYCGEEHSCIEPDARKYLCESCGEEAVFGAEQILVEGFVG